jgi:hypothetical protein
MHISLAVYFSAVVGLSLRRLGRHFSTHLIQIHAQKKQRTKIRAVAVGEVKRRD